MLESVLAVSGSETSMLAARRRGRSVRVELLDGNILDLELQHKAKGLELLEKVCEELELLETDYFGLQHEHKDTWTWVDLDRRLSKTFKNLPWEARLAVRFHPPEPAELRDDLTRYQLKLAVRRDILEGRLHCSTVTHALLASYLLQSELGDYEDTRLPASSLSEHKLVPSELLTAELAHNIIELYKQRSGQTPAEAELHYLENAKKLTLYGVELHAAQDCDGVDIRVGVCAGGVSVYRDALLMNRFPWSKVLKLSFRSRVFTIRLRAADCDAYEIRLGFRCARAASAKALWKSAVEKHIFFRRAAPVKIPRLASLPRLGSRRSSCRATLHQLRCAPARRAHEPLITRSLLVR